MATESSTAHQLPLPPRLSASPASSPATVGAFLTKAGGAPREACSSPRSLLSRILGRGGGGGFGCRFRLPRYCSGGASGREYAGEEEEAGWTRAPQVVCGQAAEARESPPRSSFGKKAAAAASLGLGAGLVLLLSKGAAELSRMEELRAQMERLVLDAKAAGRRGSSRSDASEHAEDGASVVMEPTGFAGAGEEDASSHCSRNAGAGGNAAAAAMDQMEAELEAELTRLQLASNDDDEEECMTPRHDHQLLEAEGTKSDVISENESPTCVVENGSVGIDDGAARSDHGREEDEDNEEEDEAGEMEERVPCHTGVPARELERRLHELLQSRHEERIAELESELERARRKLREKEREVSRWRDTAKLVSRRDDESRFR